MLHVKGEIPSDAKKIEFNVGDKAYETDVKPTAQRENSSTRKIGLLHLLVSNFCLGDVAGAPLSTEPKSINRGAVDGIIFIPAKVTVSITNFSLC